MTELEKVPVYIVTALQSEANPLIEKFRLKPAQRRPFREFGSDNIRLIISGMGKVNAAAATAALLHNDKERERGICINIGIAGHGSLSLGRLFVAHRISDSGTGTDWYPQMTFNPSCESSRLVTLDEPSAEYPENTGLDMEASAFYPVATRYVTAELCQVLKVVSDTPDHAMEKLDKHRISALIGDRIDDIDKAVSALRRLSLQQFDGSHIVRLTERFKAVWRMSADQQIRLQHLLERHEALFHTLPEPGLFDARLQTGNMIRQLENIVSEKGLPHS